MTQAGAEVLPEGCASAGIVGRKEQREHENQAAQAGKPHQNAKNERNADGKFAVSHKKSNGRGVRKHESAKHRHHEWIGSALEESVDPILKAAVKGELRTENLVLAKNQEENADANAQPCERTGIQVG